MTLALQGVDKTWGRPWCRPWPTLWPTLWPTGGQFFFKTRLSIAVNCVNDSLHQSVTSSTLFCPLGGVSLKFSKQTHGRLESAKPECRVDTIFRQLSYERAIIKEHVPPMNFRGRGLFIPCRLSPSFCPLPKP